MGVGLPMQWVGLGVTVGMGGENIQMSSANYTSTKSTKKFELQTGEKAA